jgi:Bacterial Ig-like domain (group 3)
LRIISVIKIIKDQNMPRYRKRNYSIGGATAIAVLVFISAGALLAAGQTAVTTYHYDNYRTGWNQSETVLTPANVGNLFGLLRTVALDDQVDAQPLVVPGVQITAGTYLGTHDVVYVATENNTVYAIDVHTGTVLLNPNFGTPVSYPLGCRNNGPNVGITSTPVIDPSSNTLYVMVYTQDPSGPAYRLHALDLGSLTDQVTPQVVTASHMLNNGTTFNFNATYQRQRPALLLANGSIYAGFGSFCDLAPNLSRGWLLGWTAGSLTPFPSNQLNDQQATAKTTLSSIWMSGYGPAADDAGNILFVTGNSDQATYDGVTNIQESVVQISPTLTTVLDLFTPDNQVSLDQDDLDFGSGGVLVLPDQPGSTPHLAVAAGKDGTMYLMNEDNLGGYSPTQNNVLGSYSVGLCWCGQSYFVDPADGLGRVVSSGGREAMVWKVQTSPTVALTEVTVSPRIGGSQDPGFFTTISSMGNANPIIWALARPLALTTAINLFAFDPESGGGEMKVLFKGTAGAWPNLSGNANLVPVVANGLVFVASNQQLQIFGLAKATTTTTLVSSMNPSVSGKPVAFTAVVSSLAGTPTGKIKYLNGTTVLATLTLTSGSAKYTTSQLKPGANSITAVYEGDSNNGGSTSAPVIQFVLAATTTTLSSSPNPFAYRQTVVFTANVTSSIGTPPDGETVTFKQGATVLGMGTLSGGTASFSTSTLGVGTKSITAVYAGDSNFASSSKTMGQVVSKATTTTTLVSSLNPSQSGQSVSFTASVAPQFSGTPGGYVTFYDGTTVLKTVSMSGGAATFTSSTLATGTHTITGTYNGNASFVGSSASLTQTVN